MLEDPLFWVLVLPGILLGTYAQWRIKANVTEYSQVPTDMASRVQRWRVDFSIRAV
jgi:hypothetical protein